MQTTLKMNEGGRPKSPAKTALFLGIVLAGLIGFIVYELKGRNATPKPGTRTYTSVLDKINADVESLKKKMGEKEPLNVDKTLAERPAPPPKAPPEAAPAAATVVPPQPPLQPAVTKVTTEDLKAKEPAVSAPLAPPAPPPPPPPPPPLEIKGIIWTEHAPLAIVNGNLVGVNDPVEMYKVSAIEKDRVIFQDSKGERRIVKLDKEEAEQKAAP